MSHEPKSNITQEMAAAGAEVISAELGTVDMGPMFSASFFAIQVYEAMRAMAPTPKALSVMTLKLDTSDLERALNGFIAGIAEFKAAVENATTKDDEPHRG